MPCSFDLVPRGPFSMEAIRDMSCGFLHGSRVCETEPASVKLAFPRDGDFAVVGVELAADRDGVHGWVVGTDDPLPIRNQVARTLGLDHDATPFAKVLQGTPALRAIAKSRPGFRPVVAYSPYVMGGWAILSQRKRMSQAAALQVRIAKAAGDLVTFDGQPVASFPRPQTFLSRASFPGIEPIRWSRLQALASAALEGELEVASLLAQPQEEARERLMRIPGVGPWTADAILLRGCGPTDALPLSEPWLHQAVATAYGLRSLPSDAELIEIAEAWRPFRMWVSVLLVSASMRAGKPTMGPMPQRGRRLENAVRRAASAF